MNKVFLDTNILLDYVLDRGIYTVRAEEIIDSCVSGNIIGCIAPHSLTNIFYILRKTHTLAERKLIIKSFISLFEIESIDRALLEKAIDDERFDDFEDALQMACAEQWNADRIISRDKDMNL